MHFNVRLVSPWRSSDIIVGDFRFSPSLPAGEADALLCEWAPTEELLSFKGPKAWYCCEPANHANARNPLWRRIRSRLHPSEFFHHAHENPDSRVPHITIEHDASFSAPPVRLERAVAIISNTGPSPWRRDRHMRVRLRLATHPLVDLFGKREAWEGYRRSIVSRAAAPANYRGEIPGAWSADGRFACMSRYRVAVCLENRREPHYFTEKFVGAVQAGCVPVYRAHPTVRDSVLQGARWIDPAAYGDDADATLRAALECDVDAVTSANARWLASPAVQATRVEAVFQRIGETLRARAHAT